MIALEAKETFRLLKPTIKLETVDQAKSLEVGDHVKLDVTMIGDGIISETTTYSKGGYKSSSESARYYLIPFFDFEKGDKWLVTVKIHSDDFDKADKGIKAFEDFVLNDKIPTEVLFTIDGLVEEMNDDEKKYVPSDYKSLMENIYINKRNKIRTLAIPALGLLFLVAGTVLIVLYTKDKKKEKSVSEEMKINNPNNYQVPQSINIQ